MMPETVAKLVDLNRTFYQTFARSFSSTRMRLQPGVSRLIYDFPKNSRILDLGCGNGLLAVALRRIGHTGEYIGLDYSPQMLDLARHHCQQLPNTRFLPADLSLDDWGGALCKENSLLQPASFDYVLAFAVLHHLPGEALRRYVLQQAHTLLQAGGYFIHSEWQFLNSSRLRARIVAWKSIGLDDNDIDPGDYLLDWRSGGLGLRYVHLFSEEELVELANSCGFSILSTFYSDGQSRNLSLYQVWQRGR